LKQLSNKAFKIIVIKRQDFSTLSSINIVLQFFVRRQSTVIFKNLFRTFQNSLQLRERRTVSFKKSVVEFSEILIASGPRLS
jgi:hypothetical protein